MGAQSHWDPLRDYGERASEAATDMRGEGRVCPTPFPNSQGLPMGVVFFYVLGRTRMSIILLSILILQTKEIKFRELRHQGKFSFPAGE